MAGKGTGEDIAAAIGASGLISQQSKAQQINAQVNTNFIKAMNQRIQAGQTLTPEQQNIYNRIHANLGQTQNAQDIANDAFPSLTKSNEQILGDFAGTGANILSAGALEGAGGAAIDAAEQGIGAGLKQGAIEGAKQGAIAGGAQGLAGGLQNNESTSGIIGDTGRGAIAGAGLGAGIGGAVGGVAAGGVGKLGEGIANTATNVKSAITGGVTTPASEAAQIGETISPKLNSKEVKTAIDQGRVARAPSSGLRTTLFGKRPDIVSQSSEVQRAANTIQQAIPGAAKMSDTELYSSLDDKTSEMAQGLQGEMQKVPVSPDTVGKVKDTWDELKSEQAARPEFLDNEAGNIAFQQKFGNYLKQASNANTLDDVWEARKDYDSSIPNNVKQATEASSPILQTRKTMWLENRAILNSVINDTASGLGQTSQKAFADMSDMYMGQQNILTKAKVDVKGTSGVFPNTLPGWLKFGLTAGGGAVGLGWVGRHL